MGVRIPRPPPPYPLVVRQLLAVESHQVARNPDDARVGLQGSDPDRKETEIQRQAAEREPKLGENAGKLLEVVHRGGDRI